MKQFLSLVVFAGTLTIISVSSCKKEDPVAPPSSFVSPSSYSPPISTTSNIYLVANNWVNYGNQIYINMFRGVLSLANVSGKTVTVYAMLDGEETQISQGHVTYIGHELWASYAGADVVISYQCNTALPFSFLDIRVQVQ